jgi:hypothetical protein
MTIDTPELQAARRAELLEAVKAFEKNPGRKRPVKPVKLVQRRGIWVADRSAA